MNNSNPIKRIFELYTSDLTHDEIERLIKREAGEVYEFFAQDIPKNEVHRNRLIRGAIFLRSLFNAFILKLNPARRIFYLASLLFFILGNIEPSETYLILSFLILNLLLAFELADKLSAKGELDVARKIQSKLIPKHTVKIFKFDISSYYEPAREVGGDYFDVINKNEKIYIAVGDISGKGMAAAIYMVRLQSILHLLLDYFIDVKEIIINLKKYFSKNLRKDLFLTITFLSIEKDGKIKLVRAGHPPAFWFHSDGKNVTTINSKGMGIGFNDRGIFENTLEVYEFYPKPNDILFVYSDGLTEAMNVYKNQFGEEAIKQIILQNNDKSTEEIKNLLLNRLKLFRGTAYQNDDITFVILKTTS
ncbi:MAG: PP2C family protein-serine/threonine phosphatase [Stygiobacter sp.]